MAKRRTPEVPVERRDGEALVWTDGRLQRQPGARRLGGDRRARRRAAR